MTAKNGTTRLDLQKNFRANEADQARIAALCKSWECGEGDAIRRAIRESAEREKRKLARG